MNDLSKALPHLIMATVVIVAVVVLAVTDHLTGTEVLPVISAAGGFTLGGTVASGSISTAAAAVAVTSPSTSVSADPATQASMPPAPQPTGQTPTA